MGARGETRFIAGRTCGQSICFPLASVSEVGRLPEPLRGALPAALYLHRRAVPLVDLAAELGLAHAGRGAPQWFVVSRGAQPVCAVLDSVDGVRSGAPERGLIELEGRAVPVVDLRARPAPEGERPARP